MSTEMFPTNDTWILTHINNEPWIGRLSNVLASSRSPNGRVVLKVIDRRATAPAGSIVDITLDETWTQWQDMMSRAVKLTVPATAAPAVAQKPRARAEKP